MVDTFKMTVVVFEVNSKGFNESMRDLKSTVYHGYPVIGYIMDLDTMPYVIFGQIGWMTKELPNTIDDESSIRSIEVGVIRDLRKLGCRASCVIHPRKSLT